MADSPESKIHDLIAELSATGSQPIIDPQGSKVTLRGAIASIFHKIRVVYRLDSRPRHPREGDDLYGHILSLRAEGLVTQHIVGAIAEHLGLDPKALRQQVLDSLK